MTEQEWFRSDDPVAMLTHVQGKVSDRKLCLFATACCRAVWHLLTDDAPCAACDGAGMVKAPPGDIARTWPCDHCEMTGRVNRSRRAVDVAERFADGLNGRGEVTEAQDTVDAVFNWTGPPRPDWRVERKAWWAARSCLMSPEGAARGVLSVEGQAAAQAALLRDIIGNPYRPLPVLRVSVGGNMNLPRPTPHPWLTPTVLSLAAAAYEERPGRECVACAGRGWKYTSSRHDAKVKCLDCDEGHIDDGTLDLVRLAILADALEEAGCTEEAILRHLRGQQLCDDCCWRGVVPNEANRPHLRCPRCDGGGWRPPGGPHVRGCWALDLLAGKE